MEWFPWFSAYYRSKTHHLTLDQDALYRRLIDYYMESRSPLPDNDQALASICRVDILCITNASSILRAFFKSKNGMLFHDFCDDQLDLQDKKSRNRSEISKKAAKVRWKKNEVNQDDKCIEHASMDATVDATVDARGQDITGESKKEKNTKKEIPEFFDFWKLFPNQRKGNRDKAASAYRSASSRASPEEIHAGLMRYIGSEEVKAGFAKGAAAWLNDDRWTSDYARKTGSPSPRQPRSTNAENLKLLQELTGMQP